MPTRAPPLSKPSPISYVVEWRELPCRDWKRLASRIPDTNYHVDDLDPENDYMFRIRAENEFGVSDPSIPGWCYSSPEFTRKRRKTSEDRPDKIGYDKYKRPGYDDDDYALKKRAREGLDVPPQIYGPPREVIYAVEKGPVKMVCQVMGYPEPTIMWFRNEDKLDLGERFQCYVSATGTVTLEFTNMAEADVGDYKLYAENSNGHATKVMRLEIADPPCFIDPLKDVTLFLRSGGKLECRVDGLPYPEIKWNKDWRTLASSARVKSKHTQPDHWELTIDNAISRDEGMYTCIAENIAGKVFCHANVKVAEKTTSARDQVLLKPIRVEDHYHVLEEIGRGSCGVIRRVIEKYTGCEFAAKFLRVANDEQKEVLKSEMELLKQMDHKNILAFQDAYDTRNRLVLISERVTGGELFDKIIREDSLTESEAAFWIRQLLEAANYMHDRRVCHLDIKPENLFLQTGNTDILKLIDFGFARRFSPLEKVRLDYGTPEFVAPEIVRGDPYSLAADCWGIGVITYLLLSGISPFWTESEYSTLQKVKDGKWDFDPEAFEGVTDEARDFISRLLVVDPVKRWTVAEALDHPWLQLKEKRGTGLKLNTERLGEYVRRRTWHRTQSHVKHCVNVRPLTHIMADKPEVPKAVAADAVPSVVIDGADGATAGDYNVSEPIRERSPFIGSSDGDMSDTEYTYEEESFYEWSTRYTKGEDARLIPLAETSLPLRLRSYARDVGKREDPSWYEGEKIVDYERDMFNVRSIKERRMLSDVDKENLPVAPDPYTSMGILGRRRRVSSGSSDYGSRIKVPTSKDEAFPPVFKEKLRDKAYMVGSSITVRCQVLGNPPASVSWYRNDEHLYEGGRLQLAQEGDGFFSMTILHTKPNDFAVYKCIARNKLGRVTTRARLLPGDTPGRPGRPAVTMVSSNECFVIWDEPPTDGNSHIQAYRVDYRRPGDDRWTTATFTIDECALVKRLHSNTVLRFRVCAINKFGSSPYSFSSIECKTKPEGASLSIDLNPTTKRILLRNRQAAEAPSPDNTPDNSRRGSLASVDENAEPKKDLLNEIHLQEIEPTTFNKFYNEIWKGKFNVIRHVQPKEGGDLRIAKVSAYNEARGEDNLREYELLKNIDQQNIVKMVEAYKTPSFIVTIFEKCNGENVTRLLSFKNRYNEDTVAMIIAQVLGGLQYLHHHGIVHLNIHPANIMFTSRRRLDLKIIDFGCARRINTSDGDKIKGDRLGMPEFMSPEMVAREVVGVGADVWGVGVLTYILLSGVSPFRADLPEDVFGNVTYLRWDSHNLHENITKEALKFIYQVLKRMPRNRLTLEGCLEHRWLQLSEGMVKKRRNSTFSTAKLKVFAEKYRSARERQATTDKSIIDAYPAGTA